MFNASNLLGQLMQKGVHGGGQSRVQHALGNQGLGRQGGLDQLIGSFLGGSSGSARTGGSGGMGGLMEAAQQFLGGARSNPVAAGGIGALAGALLGGGKGSVKGALGGGALALLGSIALTALKNRQEGAAAEINTVETDQREIEQLKSEDTAQLLVEAMIMAAKSDGEIQDDEMQRIVGNLAEDGITAEERQFVLDKMRGPLDMEGLCRNVSNKAVAAEVYAASLFAIDVDTPEEKDYLQRLASRLGLDQQTVAQIHQMTGVAA